MSKWKAVRVKQELVDQVKREIEKSEYQNLSEFVSEAIQQRLQTLAKQRVSEYLERDRTTITPQLQEQILYTPKHVWAQITPEGLIEIGITDYFQEQLKEIVNIRTDMIGKRVSKDEPFGVVESWWFTHDLHSPLNGKIVAVNEKVIEDPFLLNADPTTWIVKVQPESSSWVSDLLNSQKYQELISRTHPA